MNEIRVPSFPGDLLGDKTFAEFLTKQVQMTPKEAEEEQRRIQKEITDLKHDREEINNQFLKPLEVLHWSRTCTDPRDPKTGELDPNLKFSGTVYGWFETILPLISELIRGYEQREPGLKRGESLFILGCPETVVTLSFLREYQTVPAHTHGICPYHEGVLFGVKVYCDPFLPYDRLLVGKGDLSVPGHVKVESTSLVKCYNMVTV